MTHLGKSILDLESVLRPDESHNQGLDDTNNMIDNKIPSISKYSNSITHSSKDTNFDITQGDYIDSHITSIINNGMGSSYENNLESVKQSVQLDKFTSEEPDTSFDHGPLKPKPKNDYEMVNKSCMNLKKKNYRDIWKEREPKIAQQIKLSGIKLPSSLSQCT